MKVVKGYPPNFEKLSKKFILKEPGIVFTYGDTVYNPSGLPLPPDLEAHEQTHVDQQATMGPEAWWDQYLEDPDFRLGQELEATKVQYQYICKTENRQGRQEGLHFLAKMLSSAVYGNMIKKKEAMELLKGP